MKSRTVWVLEQGWGNGYTLHGMFSSQPNAVTAAKFIGLEDTNVRELALDPLLHEARQDYMRWQVLMLRDGTVESAEWPWGRYSWLEENRAIVWERTKAPATAGKGIPDVLQARVWARNKKHAIKLANTLRLEMIEDGKW